jgi:hypothetical protein
MLTNGMLSSMSPLERQLYLLLVLAADRRGISFYGDQKIQRTLACTQQELNRARAALMARDLLAYDGAIYQLLSLPQHATPTQATSRETSQPSTVAQRTHPKPTTQSRTNTTVSEHDQRRHPAMPESVRHVLRDIFGRDSF